jgi:hypothetical protein
MTRTQALVLAILAGFVLLACIAVIFVVILPYDRVFPPLPTPTVPTATPTPIPTLPKFLPTGSLITPTSEPTATNTRVPTSTPRPPQPPTPTVVLELTYPLRPTATPTLVTVPQPVDTVTSTPSVTPLPPPRGFSISFDADQTTLVKGECTDLVWRVEGAATVTLDGEDVADSGAKEVCPKFDKKYQLTVRLPDSPELLHRSVKISVEEAED